jgi:peptidoglycan/LPS O-acetylase OafA/YrhL
MAVLAVVAFHAFPNLLPGGFVGVDVFFVISGFLISQIIFRQLDRGTFTFVDFYGRRARRILPALLVVLCTCLTMGWFVLLPDEYEHLGRHASASGAFVSNILLWRENGYFDLASESKPLLHLWSLAVEEQFYLLWPLVLVILATARRRSATVIAALCVISFVSNLYLVNSMPTAAFYLPVGRMWELGLGALAADFQRTATNQSLSPRNLTDAFGRAFLWFREALPWLGVGFILFAFFTFDRKTPFPGWAALLPTAGTVLIIIAPRDAWLTRRVISTSSLVFIGLISYPLYLWHWPLLSFGQIIEGGTLSVYLRISLVIVAVLLATITFWCVEMPIRRHGASRTSLALGVALGLTAIMGVVIDRSSGNPNRFAMDTEFLDGGQRTDQLCRTTFGSGQQFNYCRRTSPERPRLMVLGDSQALGVYEGLIKPTNGESIALLARGGCPPLLGVNVYAVGEDKSRRHRCAGTWNIFENYVKTVQPETVILVGRGRSYFEGEEFRVEAAHGSSLSGAAAYEAGLRAAISAFQRTSRVVYVREIPVFDQSPSCLIRPVKMPGSRCEPVISRPEIEQRRVVYDQMIDRIASEFLELEIIDSHGAFCDANSCSQLASGAILYSDKIHLNKTGAQRLAERTQLASIAEALPRNARR